MTTSWVLGFRLRKIVLVIRGEHLKVKMFFNINKNNEKFEFFCLHLFLYLNTKNSFPISMFVLMTSGKHVLHTYFTLIQEF